MDRDRQQSEGDYGYDLAHEETGRVRPPADPPAQQAGAPRAGGTGDRGEDYEYDEAHDF